MERRNFSEVPVIVLGEAEQGPLGRGTLCATVQDLYVSFGSPPNESCGLLYALQSLLYGRKTLYFRVLEEGLFQEEYFQALHLIQNILTQKECGISHFSALCLPGVGSREIIDQGASLCMEFGSFLIIRPEDLYDFLTDCVGTQK